MFISLLCCGLIASAFTFFPGADIRAVKMAMAIVFAIALSMTEIYKHGLKPFNNKWVLFLLVYIPISIILAPAPSIFLIGINVSSFWSWEPFLQIVIFSLMVFSIASHEFNQKEINLIFSTIAWCGWFMAFYVTMQGFHIDQFFAPLQGDSGPYAGFVGNPTLVAPYIAMTIPFIIYLRKWWMIPIMLSGIFFPHARATFIALSIGLLFLFATKGKIRFVMSVSFCLISLASLLFLYLNNPKVNLFLNDHERLTQWVQIAKDIKEPIAKDLPNSYPLTGRGLGSFKFVFHVQHPGTEKSPNRFHQAHNEYLELAYGIGIAGLFFLLRSICQVFKNNFSVYKIFQLGEDELRQTLLSSFLISLIIAVFTFIWQIGTTAYLTAVIIGLLHNNLKKEYYA